MKKNQELMDLLLEATAAPIIKTISRRMEQVQEAIDGTEHYAESVENFLRKMRVMGPLTETEDVAIQGLLNCARVLHEEHTRMATALKDPATVHVAMIRGTIAKPSWRTMVDLHGEVPNGEDVQLMRIAELQEQLVVANKALERPRFPCLQYRMGRWMDATFSKEVAEDLKERADRYLEESLELTQTVPGFDAKRAHTLVDYVFSRPIGERKQEVGGCMLTLAALCNTAKIDMNEEGDRELDRVWTKIPQIQAKQAAKRDIHGPLP